MRISDWSSDVCSSDLIAVVYVGRTTRNIASVKWHAKGWSGGDGVIDRRGEPGRVDFEQRRSRRSFAAARPISATLQRESRSYVGIYRKTRGQRIDIAKPTDLTPASEIALPIIAIPVERGAADPRTAAVDKRNPTT